MDKAAAPMTGTEKKKKGWSRLVLGSSFAPPAYSGVEIPLVIEKSISGPSYRLKKLFSKKHTASITYYFKNKLLPSISRIEKYKSFQK